MHNDLEICQCGCPRYCHMPANSGGFTHPKGRLLAGTCLGPGPVPRLPKDINPCGCKEPRQDYRR